MPLEFGDIWRDVQNLSPTQISVTQAQDAVNYAYRHILRLRLWFGLRRTVTFATVPDKTTGTLTLTQGSAPVQGVGTAFAPSDVGRYLQVGLSSAQGVESPIRIESVQASNQLTLAQPWNQGPLTHTPCQIVTQRYALPADGDRIIRINGPTWPAVRRPRSLIDFYDPVRQQRGIPLIFAEAERIASTNAREFELWPVPNQADTYTLEYRVLTPDLTNDFDQPVIFPEAVHSLSKADMCKRLASRTGEYSFRDDAKAYREDYKEVIEPAIREDQRMRGPQPQVLDSDDSVPFWDAAYLSWQRQYQSLAGGRLA